MNGRRLGHHGSHRRLLDLNPPTTLPAHMDAIVVPTARQSAYLRYALTLGRDLDCPVFVLCSHRATATAAASQREAEGIGTKLIAVDVPDKVNIPELVSSRFMIDNKFDWPSNLGLKRNIALAVSRMVGWQRIFLLDDDMSGVSAEDVRGAAGLLGRHLAVGLRNRGYPDNSVVCHAYRAVGGRQESFVGGGAMAVAAGRATSFFPDIYNEDWFFLLDGDHGLGSVAVTGEVEQKAYEPFRNTERALREEFGDCLAEGLFALLDDDGTLIDANFAYWEYFLESRRALIASILGKVPGIDHDAGEKKRMTAALKAAQGRHHDIHPQLCVDYLSAWQADRRTWRGFIKGLPSELTPRQALERIGLSGIIRGF